MNHAPSVIADIRRHDLADVRRLQYELAAKHRVVAAGRAGEVPGAPLAYDFTLGAVDYQSGDTDGIYHGQLVLYHVQQGASPDTWPVIEKISKTLSLRTHYRATDAPRPPWPRDFFDIVALEEYVRWLEAEPWYIPDLPGVSWLLVAWNVLEGLCLRHLLNSADEGRLPQ